MHCTKFVNLPHCGEGAHWSVFLFSHKMIIWKPNFAWTILVSKQHFFQKKKPFPLVYLSPVSPIFHTKESVTLPFHSKMWQTSSPVNIIELALANVTRLSNVNHPCYLSKPPSCFSSYIKDLTVGLPKKWRFYDFW